MKTENEKLTVRYIIIAAILLVLCVLSITTMCYTLGIYSYTGRTQERLTDNGFGVLDGESEMLRMVYYDYLGFQICSIVILVLGVLSFAALGCYLYSLFAPKARLRLRFSVWAVSGLNLACSGAYVVEGIILVVQGNGLFRDFGMEGTASVLTVAYVPIILSAVGIAALIVVYRLMTPVEVTDDGAYVEEPGKFETPADGSCDDSADLGMDLSYADGERLSGKDLRYLKKLMKLHDEGVLSDGEFAEEKTRILNREFH